MPWTPGGADEEEPGVGSGGGEDDEAGRAVRRAGEEGPAVNVAVHRGAVDRPEGLPPPAWKKGAPSGLSGRIGR